MRRKTGVHFTNFYIQIAPSKPNEVMILSASGLWGLVNNAALNVVGDIELVTMSQFIRVLDINILGAVRVTKAFLPFIRKNHGMCNTYTFMG